MAGSVQRAFEQQRFFVAQASHQLRNPLTALRLRVELLGPHVRESGVEEHRHALSEVERLSTMLDALLRFAGTEAAQADRRPIAVALVLTERVACWAPAYTQGRTPLVLNLPERPPEARLVPGVLDQVLDALLDNALKFAPGAPVRLDVAAADGKVVVTVTDGGPGLCPADLERVGERFWRSPAHQNAPGTGLGLAIAAKLMEAAGGHLEILPASPQGLRAVVTLPAEMPRQIEAPPQDGESRPVSSGVVAVRERRSAIAALRGTTGSRLDAAPVDTSRSPTGD
ncbi:MAG TPA: HAMP domain-containing sensor histidine kinase, partial [Cryptosporangiaceae bacterium]|nr:HAMP domain-containing sensor histidine kinase [Cryptosporangiaceae bacterium]